MTPTFKSSRTALGAGSIRHMVGQCTPSELRSCPLISSAGRTGFAVTYYYFYRCVKKDMGFGLPVIGT